MVERFVEPPLCETDFDCASRLPPSAIRAEPGKHRVCNNRLESVVSAMQFSISRDPESRDNSLASDGQRSLRAPQFKTPAERDVTVCGKTRLPRSKIGSTIFGTGSAARKAEELARAEAM